MIRNRTRRALVVLVFVLGIAPFLHAGEVFVSPTGDDGATGAKDKPLKTLSAALGKANKGDTITLAPGKYVGG